MNQFPGTASETYAKPLQHVDELDGLIEVLQREGVRSYLEIGARYGGSFERIMMALPLASSGVAVDFPGWSFGDDGSSSILLATMKRLKSHGRDVHVIFGPSAAPEVVERVAGKAPFDAILIDADHSYDAVKRDFELYSRMGRIVILHDIAAPEGVQSHDGHPVEVPTLWQELKQTYRHEEIITDGSLMGIGVIYRHA